jgi:IQ and AAA domain-containing protein
MNDLQE